MDPQYNDVQTNALESVGKSTKKGRKASSYKETKRRFKKNTVTVKPPAGKKIKIKK